MLHLLNCTVNPALHLGSCLKNWHDISLKLREPPRARVRQTESLEKTCCLTTSILSHDLRQSRRLDKDVDRSKRLKTVSYLKVAIHRTS